MELLALAFIGGGVVAIIAASKDRSPFLWFLYGALIFPFALTQILVSRSLEPENTPPESPPMSDIIVMHKGHRLAINRQDGTTAVDDLRFATPQDAQEYIDRQA